METDRAKFRWHYGPTDADPEPGKMWHYDCGGEVWFFDGGYVCRVCGLQGEDDAEGYTWVVASDPPEGEPRCVICDGPSPCKRHDAEWWASWQESDAPAEAQRIRVALESGEIKGEMADDLRYIYSLYHAAMRTLTKEIDAHARHCAELMRLRGRESELPTVDTESSAPPHIAGGRS